MAQEEAIDFNSGLMKFNPKLFSFYEKMKTKNKTVCPSGGPGSKLQGAEAAGFEN